MKKILLHLVCVGSFYISYAQSGNLDPSFGFNGRTFTDFFTINSSFESAKRVLLQKDGKIIVVLQVGDPVKPEFTRLVLLLANGVIDSSFGLNGLSEAIPLVPSDALLQTDEKIIVVGGKIIVPGTATTASISDFALARFTADGLLDRTFGNIGFQSTDLGFDDVAVSVALLSNGRILLAGYSFNGTKNGLSLARYNSNGWLDDAFDIDGKLTTNFIDFDYKISDMVLQSNGKIITGGISTKKDNQDFALIRLNSNGALDKNFGNRGTVITDFGNNEGVSAIAIQKDGKIVAAGTKNLNSSDQNFALALYNHNGSLDNTFNGNGTVTTDIGNLHQAAATNDFVTDICIQPEGKIVVAGFTDFDLFSLSRQNFAIARYNKDGTLDNAFNDDGIQVATFGGSRDFAYSLALQGDGKAVLGGTSITPGNGSDFFSLARFQTNGSLDNTFSEDGLLLNYYPSVGSAEFNDIAVQPDGKIVAGGVEGYSTFSNLKNFFLVRYNSDGSLDKTFNGVGKLSLDFFNNEDQVNSVAIQNDGKIVLAGYTVSTAGNNYDFALARYNSNGTIDNTFGNSGKVVTDFGFIEIARSIAIQQDGKIVVGGSINENAINNFALARYNSDGSLDVNFSSDGKQTTSIGGDNIIQSITIQDNGKIIAAGYAANGNDYDFALARYNSDGILDNTFSNDGKQTTDFGTFGDFATTMALQPDGKIVLAGYIQKGASQDFALARYNPNGSLDITFNEDGKQTTGFNSFNYASSIFVQSNGKIIVSGFTEFNFNNHDFALARFNSNGSLDNSFGKGGKQTTDFTGLDHANAIAIFHNRLFVAGSVTDGVAPKGILAAFQLESSIPAITINDLTV